MGFFGSVGRLAGRAALRGTGQLVAVVVPDSITPWNLRKKTSRTSASLLSSGLRALAKRKKRKQASKKSAKSSKAKSKATRTSTAVPSAFLPWTGWPTLDFLKPRKPKVPTAQLLHEARGHTGPRPSSTKGRANISRRSVSTAPLVSVVHVAPASAAPRFDKNAWARGANLRSTTNWDTVSADKWKPTSRLARAKGRKKRAIDDRFKYR